MAQHLAVPDYPLLCCKADHLLRAITCNLRPGANDLSPQGSNDLPPQSACAGPDQRFLKKPFAVRPKLLER